MAHQEEVRRLVLLIMISSPVPTWNASGLTKVLRMRSPCIRAALDELIDMGWVRQSEAETGFWSFLRAPRYCVTPLGYAEGIEDFTRYRVSSRKVDGPPRLSEDSLTGLLPIAGGTAPVVETPSRRAPTVQAPPMFALCATRPDGATDTVAWGLHFTYCVVLTNPAGEPLGRFPNPHSARRQLARRLGIDKDALCILWIPPRKAARTKAPRAARSGDLSSVR